MHRDPKLHADTLAQQVGPKTDNALSALFAAEGQSAPQIIWAPKRRDLPNPFLRQFFDLYAEHFINGIPLPRSQFDLEQMRGLLDWVLLVDVSEDGETFTYRHYGAGIADIRGVTLVGQSTSAFGGVITTFFEAIYRAAITHKRPVYTLHEPPKFVFARMWERLILPLADSKGNVCQFLVVNIPDNEFRAGLEIIPDPVLIADADQVVRFANRAAREMFDRPIYIGSKLDIFEFAGLEIVMPAPPRVLAQEGSVRDIISLSVRDTMIEKFHLTISGIEQWNADFYVILLRPTGD